MRLRDAIIDAARYVKKGKGEHGPLEHLRLVAKTDDELPAVVASDGDLTVWNPVDDFPALPNTLVHFKAITAVARQAARFERLELSGGERIDMRIQYVSKDTVHTVHLETPPTDISQFVAMPAIPREAHWTELEALPEIIHAAQCTADKKEQNPVLRCLNFRRDRIQATDRHRIHTVWTNSGVEALVPNVIFKNLTKTKDVEFCLAPPTLYLRVNGDQMRWCPTVQGAYPEINKVLPDDHQGHFIFADRDGFTRIVDKARALHPLSEVLVRIAGDELTVFGHSDIDGEELVGTLAVQNTSPEVCDTLVNGNWLYKALRGINTQVVRFGYWSKDGRAPVRVEGGASSIAIWPKQAREYVRSR